MDENQRRAPNMDTNQAGKTAECSGSFDKYGIGRVGKAKDGSRRFHNSSASFGPHNHQFMDEMCSSDAGSNQKAARISTLHRGLNTSATMRSSIRVMISVFCCLHCLPIVLVSSADFEPYELNGGLVSAVAGKDFCILAADTRMFNSGGYNLASRHHLKSRMWSVETDSTTQLGEAVEDLLRTTYTTNNHERATLLPSAGQALLNDDHTTTAMSTITKYIQTDSPSAVMIGSAGCSTDCEQLKRVLRSDLRASRYFGYVMSVPSSSSSSSPLLPDQVATLLSQALYLRRGFPYYSFCVVAGMDPIDNHGKAYVYDAIGSYEQVAVATAGTGREALQPVLDRTFACQSRRYIDGTADEAIDTLYHAYQSVSEREIGVGDTLVLCVTERKLNDDANKPQQNGAALKRRIVLLPLKEH